jgi:hypothetical protein
MFEGHLKDSDRVAEKQKTEIKAGGNVKLLTNGWDNYAVFSCCREVSGAPNLKNQSRVLVDIITNGD